MQNVKRALCAGLAVTAAAVWLGYYSRAKHYPQTIGHSESEVFFARNSRRVYPLSVIPGGAYSAGELALARRVDPVVAAHYADFGDNVEVRPAASDMLVYVSYRKANRVYWTRTKRRIPKGETLLADGRNMARTRCGNRLSFTPQQPTQQNEPADEALNGPEPLGTGALNADKPPDVPWDSGNSLLPEDLADAPPFPDTGAARSGATGLTNPTTPAFQTYPVAGPGAGVPLFFNSVPPPGGNTPSGNTPGGGGDPTPTTPITSITTPEPGSIWLLILGAFCGCLFINRNRLSFATRRLSPKPNPKRGA